MEGSPLARFRSREVIVNAPQWKQMTLRFDDTMQEFKTRDWDGKTAIGKRITKNLN
jgi:hypothetical protein